MGEDEAEVDVELGEQDIAGLCGGRGRSGLNVG